MPRNRTPVVTGRPEPSGKKFGIVASATVNGFHAFTIGTLAPLGPKFPPNGSGVDGLTIRRREVRRESCEVKAEVVATPLVIGAGLWTELDCMGADDTGGSWICVGINRKGTLIERRSCRVWCRVRKGRVHAGQRETARAEKHAR